MPRYLVMPSVTASMKPSKHVCPDCGRSYKAAETLNRHRKNHSDTTHYACSICDASFKRKDLLDRHAQIHLGGKPTNNRNRSQRACDRCSRLKTRCDNTAPCTRCSKGGHDCTYKQLRSKARTDRSSASTSSSIHSSPHMTAEELSSLVGTPEDISTFDSNPTWTDDDGMVDSLWLQDPAWEWPQMLPHLPVMEPEPSSLRSTLPPIKDAIDPSFVLDPALDFGTSHRETSSSIPSTSLYDDVSHDSISWFPSKPAGSFDRIPVGPTTSNTRHTPPINTNKNIPSDTGRHARFRSTPTPTPTLSGEAARIAQESTIAELVALVTSSLTNPDEQPLKHKQKHLWQSLSSKLELAFNLSSPTHKSTTMTLLGHFVHLFHKFFNATWPAPPPPPSHIKSKQPLVEICPPHLYLAMAALGAAYAGPQAEAFHVRVVEALRPRLVEAARMHIQPMTSTSTEPSDAEREEIFTLVQSLSLLLAGMNFFGDRKALDVAEGVMGVIVLLGRRIGLLGRWDQGVRVERDEEDRKRLVYGVVRLDEAVVRLFGTEMLLTREERDVGVPEGAEEVLDRLFQKGNGMGMMVSSGAGMEWESS